MMKKTLVLGFILSLVVMVEALTLTECSNEIVNARHPYSSLKLKLDAITLSLKDLLATSEEFIQKVGEELAKDQDFQEAIASYAFQLGTQDFIHLALVAGTDAGASSTAGWYNWYDIRQYPGITASKTFSSGANTFKVFRNGVLMRRGPAEDYIEVDDHTISFNYQLNPTDKVTLKEERRQINTGSLLDRFIVSIEGVQNPSGNIDLVDLSGSMDIVPDDLNNKISFRVKTPSSIGGVNTNGGALALLGSGTLQVIADDLNDRITFRNVPDIRSTNSNLAFAISPTTGIATASLTTVDRLNTMSGNISLVQGGGASIVDNLASKTITISFDGDSLFKPLIHEVFIADGVQTDFTLPGTASFTNDKSLEVFRNGILQGGYTIGDAGDYYEVGSQTVRFFQPPLSGDRVILRVVHGIGQGASGGVIGLNGIQGQNQAITLNTDTGTNMIITPNVSAKTLTFTNLSPLSVDGVQNQGGNIDLRGGKVINGTPTNGSNDLIVLTPDDPNNRIEINLNANNVLTALQGLGTGFPFMRQGDSISLLANNSGYITTAYGASTYAPNVHSHSQYMLGLSAGTNVSVSNNGNGYWTVNSTGGGSTFTGGAITSDITNTTFTTRNVWAISGGGASAGVTQACSATPWRYIQSPSPTVIAYYTLGGTLLWENINTKVLYIEGLILSHYISTTGYVYGYGVVDVRPY